MTSELKPSHVVEAAGGIPYRWIASGKTASVDERAEKASKFADARASHSSSKRKRPKHKLPLTQAEIHFRAIITQLEVCLVHRPKYDDWSWPKGKLEEHESSRHAAIREMEEETGMPVALGPSIGEVEYPLSSEGKSSKHSKTNTKTGAIYTKHVVYWMAHPIPAQIAEHRKQAIGTIKPAKTSEIDEVRWLPIPQARKLLSHPLDRDILDQFVDRIQEGALKAQKLIIVRHSKAVARKRWEGTDANRPIIPRGAAASFALDQELGCYAPQRLVSSPWLRCMETLEPYAWHTGLEVEQLPALTEDAFAADPDAAWQCVRDVIDDLFAENAGTSAAKCAVQAGTKAVVKISDTNDSANQPNTDTTADTNLANHCANDDKTEEPTDVTPASDKNAVNSAVSPEDAQSPDDGQTNHVAENADIDSTKNQADENITSSDALDSETHADVTASGNSEKAGEEHKEGTGNTAFDNDDALATDSQTSSNSPGNTPKQYSRATAICMHRPVIGGIFEHLRAICASKSLAKQLIAKSPYMPTGNAVALFIVQDAEGPRIIDIQRMAPVVY